ncbi:MAG: ABC transporter permease [Acidobacteria bacterium]|nr:ABC transporter permease [Acidobacteriota bacterium]
MIRDLRYALRMFCREWAFTLVALLSLALGTGANSTMFSVVNGLLLRPLPVARPDEVLTIAPKDPDNAFGDISYPDYLDFRDNSKTMTDMVAFTVYRFGFSATPDSLPQVKYGMVVSGNLFAAMGVAPMLGRAFRPEEDEVPGRAAVVVLGHDFWRDTFGGSPEVVGRTIRLNGLDFSVIGVAPESFTGMNSFFKVAMFVPAMMLPGLAPDPQQNPLASRESRIFTVKGRLQPGVGMVQAETEIANIAKGLEETYPATNKGQTVTLRTESQMNLQYMPQESGFIFMAMMMGGLVLVISCCNVANLLLSRARSREIAVRLAVGAGRPRLTRQLLTESLLLGSGGVAAGLWFAWAAGQLLNRIKLPSEFPFMIDVQLTGRVLVFSLAAGLLSVMLFGLAPALQSTKLDLVSALKTASNAGPRGRRRLMGRNILVVGQIAISVVLLIVAAVIYRGFSSQFSAGAGFRTNHILMMAFDPQLGRYDAKRTDVFYQRLVERAASAPGVKSASLAMIVPLAINQRAFSVDVAREGYPNSKNEEKDNVLYNIVDEHFFETLGIPLLQGRSFASSDDMANPPVVVVNQILAETYWPGQNATGKRIQVGPLGGESRWMEIVGVARAGKYVWMTEEPTQYLYLPLAQNRRLQRVLIAESYGDSANLGTTLREVVGGLDPNMPVFDVRTMEEFFSMQVEGSSRTVLYVIGSMGLTGLILAITGLYGLVTYSVNRRTREFGLRMALGARTGSVQRMVLAQGGLLCLSGVALGLTVSFPLSGLLKSVVYTADTDWMPYAVVPLLLMLVTLMAAFVPARRASRIDPMKALRDE